MNYTEFPGIWERYPAAAWETVRKNEQKIAEHQREIALIERMSPEEAETFVRQAHGIVWM